MLILQNSLLSNEAKAVWIEYYNEVEAELHEDGSLSSVRDCASKSADNAARIAALFHIIEGETGDVSAENMGRGVAIASWHLSESLRFFSGVALPERILNAIKLDAWLLKQVHNDKGFISAGEAIQYGPIRDAKARDAAVEYLSELNRARIVYDGQRKLIQVNPALIGGV